MSSSIKEASMANRAVFALLITIVLALSASAQTDVSSVFNPLFTNYCTSCHNQTRKIAGLALDSLNTSNVSENTAVWEKLLQRLRARRDPPYGSPHPDDAVYQSAIAAAESALDRAYPTIP